MTDCCKLTCTFWKLQQPISLHCCFTLKSASNVSELVCTWKGVVGGSLSLLASHNTYVSERDPVSEKWKVTKEGARCWPVASAHTWMHIHKKSNNMKDYKDGLLPKSNCCASKGPELGSLHPYSELESTVWPWFHYEKGESLGLPASRLGGERDPSPCSGKVIISVAQRSGPVCT